MRRKRGQWFGAPNSCILKQVRLHSERQEVLREGFRRKVVLSTQRL